MRKLFVIVVFTIVLSLTIIPESFAYPWIHVGSPTVECIVAFTIKHQTAYVITDTGVYMKQDCLNEQSQWQKITGDIGLYPSGDFRCIDVAVNSHHPDSVTIYVGTHGYPSRLLMSRDKGNTWIIAHEGSGAIYTYHLVIVDPRDWQKIWAATWPGLIVSEDGGENWSSVDPPDYQYISSICFDPIEPLIVYVSTEGIEPHYGSVFKTTDGGKSWQEKNQGLPWSGSIGTICADPQTPGILYAVPTRTCSLTVYKTVNGGELWEGKRVADPPTSSWFAHILVHPCYSNILYLGTASYGLLQSFDQSLTWSTIIVASVPQIAIEKEEPQKIYTLFEDGIWCYEDPQVTAVEDLEEISWLPVQSALLQNYPNPFNSQTMISYQLPEESHVSLRIYNLLGQEIKTLVKERQAVGTHRVCWSGEDARGKAVASGVYFCQLQAGGYTETKKMILLR